MDAFMKSVDTPEEAINVFKQMQPLLSKHGLKPKKWITNDNKVTEEIPGDLRSISDTKQVEVGRNRGDRPCLDFSGLLLKIV